MKHIPLRISVSKGTLQSIIEGQKTTLIRTDDRVFACFRVGNSLKIVSGDRGCTCEIVAIRRYESLEDILASEDLSQIAHGNREEALYYLLNIYEPTPPEHHRFVVLQLKRLKVGRKPC